MHSHFRSPATSYFLPSTLHINPLRQPHTHVRSCHAPSTTPHCLGVDLETPLQGTEVSLGQAPALTSPSFLPLSSPLEADAQDIIINRFSNPPESPSFCTRCFFCFSCALLRPTLHSSLQSPFLWEACPDLPGTPCPLPLTCGTHPPLVSDHTV